jgi:transcriptional regulator with XRE-family HTH domain
MENEGLKLKVFLWSRRISQNELARRTGLNVAIISMATNERYILDDTQKLRIAGALNVEPEEIWR